MIDFIVLRNYSFVLFVIFYCGGKVVEIFCVVEGVGNSFGVVLCELIECGVWILWFLGW